MARASRKQIVLKDPKAIRALSHPARITVIDELYGGRIATATELAALTGLTPSAMSWHLRAMEKLGLIERDESAADARERPWRAAARGVSIQALPTRAQQAAGTMLTGAVLDALHRELDAYIAAEHELPEPWRQASNFDTGTVYLTPEETRGLIDALATAAAPFLRRGRRCRKGTRRVRTAIAVIPGTADPRS